MFKNSHKEVGVATSSAHNNGVVSRNIHDFAGSASIERKAQHVARKFISLK